MRFPFDQENKSYFSDICKNILPLLSQVKEVLFFVSRSHPIDVQYWNMLRIKIQGFSNIMSLCVLDAEIANIDSANEVLKEVNS
jgi:hypothetical protein